MNFGIVDRKTGKIFIDYVFENTFTMLQDFGKAMEENGVKPEIECYDMGGLDNAMLIGKQGIFTDPMNFNFVWGVAGGQQSFRAETFIAMMNALPPKANFTTCGVGTDEFPCIMQSVYPGRPHEGGPRGQHPDAERRACQGKLGACRSRRQGSRVPREAGGDLRRGACDNGD